MFVTKKELMLRLIFMTVFFLLSLLTVFRAPTNLLWYVSILVTEFSWIFFVVVVVLLLPVLPAGSYPVFSMLAGLLSLMLLAIPVFGAFRMGSKVKTLFMRSRD